MNDTKMVPETEYGASVEVDLGKLVLSMSAKVDEMKAWMEKHADIVYQTPIVAQVGAGTTTTNDGANPAQSNTYPDRGTIWSIRRLSITGFTAGTVTAYINALEPVASWTFGVVNPFNYYPKGGIILQPGDNLTFGTNAVTGLAQVFGVADTFPIWYLRRYLD
jgi:hypothetical protein